MAELERRFASGAGELDVLAKEINAEHRAFVGSLQKTAEHGIRAGELLADAKASCPHGTWLPWLEKSFEGSVRTAQGYMQLYNNRDEIRANAQRVAHLGMREALQAIARPKVELEPALPQRHPGLALQAEFRRYDADFVKERIQKYGEMDERKRLYFEREAALDVRTSAMVLYTKHYARHARGLWPT